LIGLAVALAAADLSGTWKLNLGKSKFIGLPKPKDMTLVYTPLGNGWKFEANGTSADGKPVSQSFVYVKDGEPIRLTDSPFGDTLVFRNANSEVAHAVYKRDGRVVGQVQRVLSRRGTVMTFEGTSSLSDGTTTFYTIVYEKQ
jgi:hypothetical protein